MKENKNLPLASIVIPVYNGADYLKEAVDSALGQTYPNCEVIVVNDGSADGGRTERAALSYGDRIRYFSKENGKVSTALNLGLKNMRGEYFAWLSHDDVFYADKIEKQIQAMERSGRRMAAASCNFFWNSGRTAAFKPTEFYGRRLLEKGPFPVMHGMIQFGGVLLRRSVFDDYGAFREDLHTVQDYEFLFRVLKKEPCVFMDDVVNGVRIHPAQVGNTSSRMEEERDWMYHMFLTELAEDEQARIYGSAYNFYYQMLLRLIALPYTPESFPVCVEKLRRSRSPGGNVKNPSRVYIYGAGIYGRRLLFDLRCREIKVQGFLDKNEALKGKEIDGITCHALDKAKALPEGATVVIASECREEMAKTLQDMGIKNYLYKEDFERKSQMFQNPPPIGSINAWVETYIKNGWKK